MQRTPTCQNCCRNFVYKGKNAINLSRYGLPLQNESSANTLGRAYRTVACRIGETRCLIFFTDIGTLVEKQLNYSPLSSYGSLICLFEFWKMKSLFIMIN